MCLDQNCNHSLKVSEDKYKFQQMYFDLSSVAVAIINLDYKESYILKIQYIHKMLTAHWKIKILRTSDNIFYWYQRPQWCVLSFANDTKHQLTEKYEWR